MKKLSTILSILALAVFCQSFITIDPPGEGDPKIAVVSVWCNKEIKMGEFTGLGSAISKLSQDEENFNLQSIVDDLRDKTFNEYSKNLAYDVIAEEKVLKAEGYNKDKIMEGSKLKLGKNYITPEGYFAIGGWNKKAVRNCFQVIEGLEGVMIVSVDFELIKIAQIAGFGTAKVKANVQVKIFDKDGKGLMKVYKFASSQNKIKFSLGGVFDAKQIKPLCLEATNAAIAKVDKTIMKKTAKKAKKGK